MPQPTVEEIIETGRASVPASLVLVDEPDVRACADATAYAVSAYEFANGLIKAGVAR